MEAFLSFFRRVIEILYWENLPYKRQCHHLRRRLHNADKCDNFESSENRVKKIPLVIIDEPELKTIDNTDTALQVRDNGTVSASLFRPSQPNVEYKAAYSLKANDADLSVSGTESIVGDGAVVIPDENMHTLHIGGYHNNTQFLNGHIKSITYYPLKLTNNQLKALTQ